MNKSPQSFKIGVVVGGGTGIELSEIFKKYLNLIIKKKHNKEIGFLNSTDETIFSSYEDILKKENPRNSSIQEADQLFNLYKEFKKKNVKTVFRTSVNAEALYQFRQEASAVKIFGLDTDTGNKVVLVRDQAEGFYANTDYSISKDRDAITFNGAYTKAHLEKVAAFSLKEANSILETKEYDKWLTYKYHLFSGVFDEWTERINERYQLEGINAFKLYQPDTAFTELFTYLREEKKRNLLIICSNEIGDLLYEPLIESTKAASDKLTLYTTSYFFDGDIKEYQTVHGSADDKADQNQVIPYATFRIIASIAELDYNVKNCRSIMDKIISEVMMEFFDDEVDTKAIINSIDKKLSKESLI